MEDEYVDDGVISLNPTIHSFSRFQNGDIVVCRNIVISMHSGWWTLNKSYIVEEDSYSNQLAVRDDLSLRWHIPDNDSDGAMPGFQITRLTQSRAAVTQTPRRPIASVVQRSVTPSIRVTPINYTFEAIPIADDSSLMAGSRVIVLRVNSIELFSVGKIYQVFMSNGRKSVVDDCGNIKQCTYVLLLTACALIRQISKVESNLGVTPNPELPIPERKKSRFQDL